MVVDPVKILLCNGQVTDPDLEPGGCVLTRLCQELCQEWNRAARLIEPVRAYSGKEKRRPVVGVGLKNLFEDFVGVGITSSGIERKTEVLFDCYIAGNGTIQFAV